MSSKALLNSLSLPQQCALIALPLLVAFGFLFQQMYAQVNTLISSSQNELAGAETLEKLNPLFQAMLAARANKQQESTGELVSSLRNLKSELPISWPNTQANLDKLVELLPQSLSQNASSEQADALGEHMVTLVRQLADESELTLDPFLPSYYMMSPMAFQLPGVMEYLSDPGRQTSVSGQRRHWHTELYQVTNRHLETRPRRNPRSQRQINCSRWTDSRQCRCSA
jgi:methyl-accepting chemotaxis protein